MANFDFSTLNSSDLEELVCSLINEKEKRSGSNVIFRTFKDGKDKGIDLFYSSGNDEFKIVGQVKHYYRSGYKALISNLKLSEKQKVIRLSPTQYFLATSVDLSHSNIVEIKDAFHPYIKSISDVYGKKDLNRMLELYPNILNQQFKLWYSTSGVLKLILHYELIGRSNEFRQNQLKRKLRLFVETPALTEARDKLKKNDFIVITGEPGIGKTTIAELLLYDYIRKGYELIYIYDDIKEAEKILDESKENVDVLEKKQIFYFDDFLGHNSVEIQKARGAETALLKVLRRILFYKNKKFIFTTRSFIFNSAIEDSENLRRFNIKTKESILKLDLYSNYIRQKLLLNHIEESDLPDIHKKVLHNKDVQNFIINHSNFSPRSVEFITSYDNCINLPIKDYEKFVYKNFNKPDEIWRHAYEQQINDFDRILLNTMISFGDSVDIGDLELSYNARIDYEVKYNNFVRPLNSFKYSLRRLEGGFIVQETYNNDNFKFINPSLVDFLLGHLRDNYDEVIRITESAVFLRQLTARIFPLHIPSISSKFKITSSLREKIIFKYDYFIKPDSKNLDALILIILLTKNFKSLEIEEAVMDIFLKIDDWSFLEYNYSEKVGLVSFLKELTSISMIKFIKDHGEKMFAMLILTEVDIDELISLLEGLFLKFKQEVENLLKKSDLYLFNDFFDELLDRKVDEDIEYLLECFNPQSLVDAKELEMTVRINTINSLGLKVKANLSKYSTYNWWDIAQNNYFNEQMSRD